MTTARTLAPPAPSLTAAPAAPARRPYLYDAFPEFPSRDDMQNALYLDDPAHQAALRRHFGAPDTTVVIGEVPVGWRRDQREGIRVPDLLIAFNVDRAVIVAEKGYAIECHGKPPDFVLEIASDKTARRDEVRKRRDYAEYGVTEYWRFDHEWGQNYAAGLSGDRLDAAIDGNAYQPITIHRADENRYWGHSITLNLDVCWEYGELRWYDPVAQRYLPTFDEAYDERERERARRIAVEDAYDAAVDDLDAARARILELEAQLRERPAADAAPGL